MQIKIKNLILNLMIYTFNNVNRTKKYISQKI